LRELAFRHSYALIAAGSLGRTLIGRLPARSRQIGPVAAVSYRVASRISNSLKAGRAVRGLADLDQDQIILFHAPPDQIRLLLHLCFASPLNWQGRTIVFCDCEPPSGALAQLRATGVFTATARTFGVPGFAAIQGGPHALPVARRIVREAGLRPLEIASDRADLFSAALTLATAALTPLIDRAAYLLRCAGLRDSDSIRVAEMLFQQTVRGYARSGRQSWSWHIGAPSPEQLEAELCALDSNLATLLQALLLLGFEIFEKHPEIASSLRRSRPC
jgi:predicted short-subunit dehydrogenase-like oxidoreductase (DUF2520 family)